ACAARPAALVRTGGVRPPTALRGRPPPARQASARLRRCHRVLHAPPPARSRAVDRVYVATASRRRKVRVRGAERVQPALLPSGRPVARNVVSLRAQADEHAAERGTARPARGRPDGRAGAPVRVLSAPGGEPRRRPGRGTSAGACPAATAGCGISAVRGASPVTSIAQFPATAVRTR